jgi:hypothetical protein
VCCLSSQNIAHDTRTHDVSFHRTILGQCLSPLHLSEILSGKIQARRSADGLVPIVTYADHVAAMLGRTHLDGSDGILLVACSSPSRNRTSAAVACDTSTNSSPSSDRVKAIRESPNWRPTEASFANQSDHRETTFVHRSGREADDVFGSPNHAQVTQSSGEGRPSLHKTAFPSH